MKQHRIEFIVEYTRRDDDCEWHYNDNHGVLVRCKDCKYGEPTKNGLGESVIKCHEICGLCGLSRLMELDWFCADGESKDVEAIDNADG